VRIRTLVKYGMTAAQVAGIYGVAIDVIERILRKA
jgi:transposase